MNGKRGISSPTQLHHVHWVGTEALTRPPTGVDYGVPPIVLVVPPYSISVDQSRRTSNQEPFL